MSHLKIVSDNARPEALTGEDVAQMLADVLDEHLHKVSPTDPRFATLTSLANAIRPRPVGA